MILTRVFKSINIYHNNMMCVYVYIYIYMYVGISMGYGVWTHCSGQFGPEGCCQAALDNCS